MKKKEYITVEEFLNNSGIEESTFNKNHKKIPGVVKCSEGYRILSGTRYPYNMRNTKLINSDDRRYTLLKAISTYKYISHDELRLEKRQFDDMLKDLIRSGLIRENGLSNHYGANAYDCTASGEDCLRLNKDSALKKLADIVASAGGHFTGALLSEIYNVS